MHFPVKSAAIMMVGFFPTTSLADFSGAYAGAAIAGVSSEFELSFEDESSGDIPLQDGVGFSAFAGYQLQSGDLVYGGEIAVISASDIEFLDFVDIKFDTVATDIKGRLGYVFDDKIMAYGTAGYTTLTVKAEGEEEDADGFIVGAGVDYLMTENIVIGAEFTNRQVDTSVEDIDVDLDVNSVALRASFKF